MKEGYQGNDDWVAEIMQDDVERMKHHQTLSPSRFPALEHCIHYESLPADSESRRRGTKIHEYYAKLLQRHLYCAEGPNERPDVRN